MSLITLADYQRKKQERLRQEIPPRWLCYACWRPEGFCYCPKIRKMDLRLKFVILIHPLEEKRPIATGRMSHLCLQDSLLIEGEDFSGHPQVDAIIADPKNHPVVLYPGAASTDLTPMMPQARRDFFPQDKRPVVFVIDGTWNTARKTMLHSRNLRTLPTIRFTPSSPSRIRVRHQPQRDYYTTIEAIHQTIELLEPSVFPSRPHDNLLEVLDYMVSLQVQFSWDGKRRDEGPRVRRSLIKAHS